MSPLVTVASYRLRGQVAGRRWIRRPAAHHIRPSTSKVTIEAPAARRAPVDPAEGRRRRRGPSGEPAGMPLNRPCGPAGAPERHARGRSPATSTRAILAAHPAAREP
jgi:hypothetical protein